MNEWMVYDSIAFSRLYGKDRNFLLAELSSVIPGISLDISSFGSGEIYEGPHGAYNNSYPELFLDWTFDIGLHVHITSLRRFHQVHR